MIWKHGAKMRDLIDALYEEARNPKRYGNDYPEGTFLHAAKNFRIAVLKFKDAVLEALYV